MKIKASMSISELREYQVDMDEYIDWCKENMDDYGYTDEDFKQEWDCMLSQYIRDTEVGECYELIECEATDYNSYGYNESELKSFIRKKERRNKLKKIEMEVENEI
jgi:hypothetical protein